MKNNIAIQVGANPEPFFQQIIEHLDNNISSNLCQSLANLLSLDYANRLSAEPPLNEYIDGCLKRLKQYLGTRVILDNNFSEAMTLFTVAITPDKDPSNDKLNSQEQSQDALIESTISAVFGKLTPEEQQSIKLVIKDLLNSKDGEKLMNMMSSEPKIFQKIIINALEAKTPSKEISNIVSQKMGSLAEHSDQIKNKSEGLRSIVGKLALAGGILVAASLGLVVSGLALPALIVPATIAAIKIAPTIGEKIASNIINNNATIQNQTKQFEQAKILSTLPQINNIYEKTTEQPAISELSQEQVKSLAKTVDTTSIETPNVPENEPASKTQTLEDNKNKSTRSI